MPVSDIDLGSEAHLADPYPTYTQLRKEGPAVYLQRHSVWAITRHRDVKSVLEDPATFSSRKVALNAFANSTLLQGTVLTSDGADHRRLRKVLSQHLAPRALAELTDWIQQEASRAVTDAMATGRIDAVNDLAMPYLVRIFARLLGLDEEDQAELRELVRLAQATFNAFGEPTNALTRAGLPLAEAMFAKITEHCSREKALKHPHSWAAGVYAAVDAGQIREDEAVPLLSAYFVAGVDTLIHGLTHLLHQLAIHPEQWAQLTHDPTEEALAGAWHEALRHGSPVQWFAREVTRTTTVGEAILPLGSQVLLLYGSANRDPDKWGLDAHHFTIHRPDAREHLALGAGPHTCAGGPLAQLEVTTLLRELTRQCPHMALTQTPVRQPSSILRGLKTLPLTLHDHTGHPHEHTPVA